MNWEAIASIGEFVSAIAILITLAYLAIQIKYARIAASDVSRNNRVEGIRQLDRHRMENSALRIAWYKASPEMHPMISHIAAELDLTIEEAELIILQGTGWMWTHWAQFRSIKTEEDTRELENIISVFYSTNPMAAVVAHPLTRAHFDHEFIDWIDEVLANCK